MRTFSRIISAIFRNLLVFLVGGVLGLLGVLIFAQPLLEHSLQEDIGLGIIAVAPLLLLLYAALFWLGGGILALLAYHLIRFLRRRNRTSRKQKML